MPNVNDLFSVQIAGKAFKTAMIGRSARHSSLLGIDSKDQWRRAVRLPQGYPRSHRCRSPCQPARRAPALELPTVKLIPREAGATLTKHLFFDPKFTHYATPVRNRFLMVNFVQNIGVCSFTLRRRRSSSKPVLNHDFEQYPCFFRAGCNRRT